MTTPLEAQLSEALRTFVLLAGDEWPRAKAVAEAALKAYEDQTRGERFIKAAREAMTLPNIYDQIERIVKLSEVYPKVLFEDFTTDWIRRNERQIRAYAQGMEWEREQRKREADPNYNRLDRDASR